MAGNGPLPKPDADRRRRNSPTYDWTRVPASGRSGPPPAMPKYRKWHPLTVETWNDWWKSPVAVAWDQSGRTLHRWLILLDRLFTDPDAPVSLHSEIVKIEDRHGMSDGARMKLRMVIVPDDAEPAAKPTSTRSRAKAAKSAKSQTSSLATRLKVVK